MAQTARPETAASSEAANGRRYSFTERLRTFSQWDLSFLERTADYLTQFSRDHSKHTQGTSMSDSQEQEFAELEKKELPLPDLVGVSEVLNDDHRRSLVKELPARAQGYPWTLLYSTSKHGFSLKTLYREMVKVDTPVLLIVQDTKGMVFGAVTSNSIHLSDLFYGTGETFLFTFHPEFLCFPWTGNNEFFIKGDTDSLAIGAGDGHFGLWLDGDLYHGRSYPCNTFANLRLNSEDDFVVKHLECWGFV
ncbi:Oxidation resistance protein 1 [Halotydeus destructor]|nr:Oxidation resistance protein 1 [Halotydeus destructor]